jgi:hypothetical protein
MGGAAGRGSGGGNPYKRGVAGSIPAVPTRRSEGRWRVPGSLAEGEHSLGERVCSGRGSAAFAEVSIRFVMISVAREQTRGSAIGSRNISWAVEGASCCLEAVLRGAVRDRPGFDPVPDPDRWPPRPWRPHSQPRSRAWSRHHLVGTPRRCCGSRLADWYRTGRRRSGWRLHRCPDPVPASRDPVPPPRRRPGHRDWRPLPVVRTWVVADRSHDRLDGLRNGRPPEGSAVSGSRKACQESAGSLQVWRETLNAVA